MPLSSRDKGITKLGGENFPEQILRLPMIFLVTVTQIINIHVFNTPLTVILSFFPVKLGALPILQECPCMQNMYTMQ